MRIIGFRQRNFVGDCKLVFGRNDFVFVFLKSLFRHTFGQILREFFRQNRTFGYSRSIGVRKIVVKHFKIRVPVLSGIQKFQRIVFLFGLIDLVGSNRHHDFGSGIKLFLVDGNRTDRIKRIILENILIFGHMPYYSLIIVIFRKSFATKTTIRQMPYQLCFFLRTELAVQIFDKQRFVNLVVGIGHNDRFRAF